MPAASPPAPLDPFYDPPSPPAASPPGTLLRAEAASSPDGAHVWRLLYTSLGVQNDTVPVSALAAVPAGDPPPGGFPVLSIGHTTTGGARICAPSIAPFTMTPVTGAAPRPYYEWVLQPFVKAGYAVVATDYRGLGTPGSCAYLAGELEARDILDAVRALRQLSGQGGPLVQDKTIVWGHSVGGQAAASAGEIAAEYAPECSVVGVVAEAPAVALQAWLQNVPLLDQPSDAVGVLMMAVYGWSMVYEDVEVESVLTPAGRDLLQLVSEAYLPELVRAYMALPAREYFLAEGFLSHPWPELIARNTPGNVKTSIPTMVAQGLADPVIFPEMTLDFVARFCRAGNTVCFRTYPGVDHFGLVDAAMGDVLAWTADRLAKA